jgi:hypothetical protein
MISSFARQAKSAVTNVSLLGRYAGARYCIDFAGLIAGKPAPTGFSGVHENCIH